MNYKILIFNFYLFFLLAANTSFAANVSFDQARESFEGYQYLYPELNKFFQKHRCPERIEKHLLYNLPRFVQNDVRKYGNYYVKNNIERIINAVRIQNYLAIKKMKHVDVAQKYLDKNLRVVACPVNFCNEQEKQMVQEYIKRADIKIVQPALCFDEIIDRLPNKVRNLLIESIDFSDNENVLARGTLSGHHDNFMKNLLFKNDFLKLPKQRQNIVLATKIQLGKHRINQELENMMDKSIYQDYTVDDIVYEPTSEIEADFCNFIKDTRYTDIAHPGNFLFDGKAKKIVAIDTETRSIQNCFKGTIHDLNIQKYDDPDINVKKMLQEHKKFVKHRIFDRYLQRVSSSMFLE